MFFIAFACGKQKECSIEYKPSRLAISFEGVSSFLEGVSGSSIFCNTYVIKGIVLDKIKYGGLKIRLVEDFKGNFPGNIEFIMWGKNSQIGFSGEYLEDDLSLYDKQDTLIMHLVPVYELLEITSTEYTWLEKPEEYATLAATFSVLKISGDYVEGCILPPNPNDAMHKYYINSTMLLKDFYEKLKRALHIYQINR